jgi:hypothetical protein
MLKNRFETRIAIRLNYRLVSVVSGNASKNMFPKSNTSGDAMA